MTALEVFIAELLDRARDEALRGNVAGSVARRVVARGLHEILLECEGDS